MQSNVTELLLLPSPASRPALLATADNPSGYSLAEVLGQLCDEIAAENAELRRLNTPRAMTKLELRKQIQQRLSNCVSIEAMNRSIEEMASRESAEVIPYPGGRQALDGSAQRGRDPRLEPGRYHP